MKCIVALESVANHDLLQHGWTRSAKRQRGERKKKATNEKESQRWLDMLSAAECDLDRAVQILRMGDREADIYNFGALR